MKSQKLFILVEYGGALQVEVTEGENPDNWTTFTPGQIKDFVTYSSKVVAKLEKPLPTDWRDHLNPSADIAEKIAMIIAIENGISCLPEWARIAYAAGLQARSILMT